jgi:dihydrofolate reductase
MAAFQEDERELFIIGGGEIYRQAIEQDIVDEMYITHVHAQPDGDTFFPNFDTEKWEKEIILRQQKDERNEFDFVVVKFVRKS